MKSLSFIAAVLLSSQVLAQGQVLNQKVINLGSLSDAEANVAISKTLEFTRNAKTPEKVELVFTLNYLEKDCVEYKVVQEDVPEFKKTVCEGSNNGFSCEEKIYSGLFNAKTVCSEQGLIRKTAAKKLTLNFKDAVRLAPTASEKIAVKLLQKSMREDSVDFQGIVLESHSLYKIKNGIIKDQIHFKAQ